MILIKIQHTLPLHNLGGHMILRVLKPLMVAIVLVIFAGCGTNSHEETPAPASNEQAAVGQQGIVAPPSAVPQSAAYANPVPPPQVTYQIPGPPQQPTLTQPYAAPAIIGGTRLFVVMAGNGSCRTTSVSKDFPGLWDNSFFRSFDKAVLPTGMINETTEVLFFCYETFSEDMYFYSSRETNLPMRQLNHSQVGSIVGERSRLYSNTTVLGYSYGGWRALKLASQLAGENAVQGTLTLVTVDPISKKECTHAFSRACRNAPMDISEWESNVLATKVRWLNQYQNAVFGIGSGFIPEAKKNTEYRSMHLLIDEDAYVWKEILGWISN